MQLALKDGLLIQKVVDELVILEPESGDYYTLNALGATMLEKIQQGLNTKQVATEISNEYQVTCEQVEQDLNELLNALKQANLAYQVDA